MSGCGPAVSIPTQEAIVLQNQMDLDAAQENLNRRQAVQEKGNKRRKAEQPKAGWQEVPACVQGGCNEGPSMPDQDALAPSWV